MARRMQVYDNIFAESPKDNFAIDASNAQAKLNFVNNPYVGNKKKLLFHIAMNCFDVLPFSDINSVCDLFAGSFIPSAYFKLLGKSVTANELLMSSYVMGVFLLKSNEITITNEEWKYLLNNKSENVNNFITENYKDTRFSSDECDFIDNFYANVKNIFIDQSVNWCACHAVLLQYVMEKCFIGGRLNCGQILAEKTHRINHKKNNGKEINFNKMKLKPVMLHGPSGKCSHSDAVNFLQNNKTKFDLIYIDPPYGGQQSDYANMYKFCEEYITQKKLENIDYLQKTSKQFVKNKNYIASFENILQNLPKKSYWLFSYNDSSWANKDIIGSCIKNQNKNVILKEINYKYNQRDASNVVGIEYLIFGI